MSISIPLQNYERQRKNNHPAKIAAETIYQTALKTGATIVVKDTGAGGSVGICASGIDAGDTVLLVVPHKAGMKNILDNTIQYSDCEWKDQIDEYTKEKEILNKARVAHRIWNPEKELFEPDPNFMDYGGPEEMERRIEELNKKTDVTFAYPTNRACKIVRDMIFENPELDNWDLFHTTCNECEERDDCGLYKSVEITDDDTHRKLYGITYSGVMASMLSYERDSGKDQDEHSLGYKRIEKIFETIDVVAIDESHMLEFGSTSTIPIYDAASDMCYKYTSRFSGIMVAHYPYLQAALAEIDKLINSHATQHAIMGCLNEAIKKGNDRRILNTKIRNPHYDKYSEGGKNKKKYKDEKDGYGRIVAMQKEMVKLHTDPKRPVERLSSIKNILLPLTRIIANEYIELQAEWNDGRYIVNMVADNVSEREAMDDFICTMLAMGKKVFFITATKGNYNYDQYLEKGGHIPTVLMGDGGDPACAAGNQVILPDTYSMSGTGRNSFRLRLPDVMDNVLNILRQEGRKRVVVVCRTAMEAEITRKIIEDEIGFKYDTEHRNAKDNDVIITYYRGPHSHSSRFYFYDLENIYWDKKYYRKIPAEVMILVGGAETPGHCMDRYCKTAKEARIMRQTEIYMQMFQMCGRVKGNGRSLVYCIGINATTVRNMIKWGTKYEMEIDDNPTHQKITIDVGKEISKPSVLEGKSWKERLDRGSCYLRGVCGVFRYADIGAEEFMSQSWDSIVKKQIQQRMGFLSVFDVPLFRQLPELPQSVKTVKLISDVPCDLIPYILYIRERGQNTDVPGFILSATDNGIQILSNGRFCKRTPNDVGGSAVSLYCGNIETVNQVLEYYREKRLKEIERQNAENRMQAIMNQVRVAKEAVQVKDGSVLLKQIYCSGTPCDGEDGKPVKGPRFAYKDVQHGGYKVARDRRGQDRRLTDEHIYSHLSGDTPILTYTIDDFDEVRYMAFDIDAHEKSTDTTEEYKRKLEAANTRKALITGALESMGIKPLVIRSGSLGSYHVVIPCLPVSAEKAHYFINTVAESLGFPHDINHETFPKQKTCQLFHGMDEVSVKQLEEAFNNGKTLRRDLLNSSVEDTNIDSYMVYGNGMKLPMCYDKKSGQFSHMWHEEEKRWVRYYVPEYNGMISGGYDREQMHWVDTHGNKIEHQYIPVHVIDIRGIEVPEEARAQATYVSSAPVPTEAMPMSPIFKWVMKQRDLTGMSGHHLRLGLLFEMALRCKMSDEDIFQAFKGMNLVDFDADKTWKYIRAFRAADYKHPYGRKKIEKLVSPANWENYKAGRPFIPDAYVPPNTT